MRRAYPKRPAQRLLRALSAFNAGDLAAAQVEAATAKARVKRGPQAETATNKEVAAWRNTKPGLLLERNKRRLATPPGMTAPIMLGWMAEGSPDWVGYESVLITPAMVGKRIAAFVGLEAKRPVGGVVSAEQQAFLDAARDAGAIVGVVRSFEDCELARARFMARLVSDER